MTLLYAVIWIDHHCAKVLRFDAIEVKLRKIQEHAYAAKRHDSAVRVEHEFFAEVCDELETIQQIVVTGSHTALSDFRNYVEERRHLLASHIVGWEVVNHPSEAQLVAFAREHFVQLNRMAGMPRPMPQAIAKGK